MLLNRILPTAKKHFPQLKILFKNESVLMKIIGFLLFFNKGYMTKFTTTIGSSIYFPSKEKLQDAREMSFVTLLHELVHMYDSQNNALFKFLYLFPQILAPIFALLLFVLSWKIVLPLILISLLPLPAYFRAQYEKRGYFISLYVVHRIGEIMYARSVVDQYKVQYVRHFKSSHYYYMYPFNSIDVEFDDMVEKIKSGEKPIAGKLMNIIDELIEKILSN